MPDVTFFDLDNTLLTRDSDYEWGRYLVDQAEVDGPSYARANAQFKADYEAGTLDINAYIRFVAQPMIDQPERMFALRERFASERIKPLVARHAQTAIDFHRRRGDVVAIITATNRFVTEPITKLLGLDYLIATDLQTVNGGYTGAIAGIPCFREGKIARARDFLAELGVRTDHITFYSDSHNDLPLLQWADQAVVVDPDPRLEAAAQQAGWSIISLRGETSPF